MTDEKKKANENTGELSPDKIENASGGRIANAYFCPVKNSEGVDCVCCFDNQTDLDAHIKAGNHKYSTLIGGFN